MVKFPQTTINFNALPSHYALEFEPNFSTFTFRAKATITLTLQKAVKLITLHTKELTIKNAGNELSSGDFKHYYKFPEVKQVRFLPEDALFQP